MMKHVHKLRTCQYCVYDPCAYEDNFTSDCGEPASYLVYWSLTLGSECMYLCEQHFNQIAEQELVDYEEEMLRRSKGTLTVLNIYSKWMSQGDV